MGTINTKNAPTPVGPYNQAIVVGKGELVFLSGQIALDPATGEVIGLGDVAKQTERVMQNIEAVLESANVSWDNVVKTTVFLSDLNNFAVMNQIYAQYFKKEIAPARSCVEVSRLPKDVLIEIDCIAIKP